MFKDEIWLYLEAAGEDIEGTIREFGPGMDGNMRFSNDDNTTDPVGRKLMKEGMNDRRAGATYSIEKDTFQSDGIVQNGFVTSVQFYNELFPQGLHRLSSPRFVLSLPTVGPRDRSSDESGYLTPSSKRKPHWRSDTGRVNGLI
jgi:hypothetical protein